MESVTPRKLTTPALVYACDANGPLDSGLEFA
jgi:hypothetical protein